MKTIITSAFHYLTVLNNLPMLITSLLLSLATVIINHKNSIYTIDYNNTYKHAQYNKNNRHNIY